MIRTAKESGCDYLLFGGAMTMRDNQALCFLKNLKDKFPELITKYEKLYGFSYDPDKYSGSYGATDEYNRMINKKLLALCKKYDMAFRIKRFIPDDFRKLNYIISEKILNHAYLLQITGRSWTGIHWAGMNIQNLKESITDVVKRNELRRIRNVSSDIEGYIIKTLGL